MLSAVGFVIPVAGKPDRADQPAGPATQRVATVWTVAHDEGVVKDIHHARGNGKWLHLLSVYRTQTVWHEELARACMELLTKGEVTKDEILRVRNLQIAELRS